MRHKYKILVVDDDLKNIQVGVNFLKKNGNYHLVFATSGDQALQRVKEIGFDLVLLDIVMPTMDGFEVCRRLKADENTKDIPVIFLTAKHEEDSLMKGFEVGGADYITKPFNAPELNARVKTHLELNCHYKKEISKLNQIITYCQKAETVKYLAGGIAHDCNNFMVSIPGNLLMIEKKLKENGLGIEDYRGEVDGINTAVKRVKGLLDQLSGFSSREPVLCEVVDLREVVEDLSKVYKGYQHNITFDVDQLSQPVQVFADKLHVEQVLFNLILNAQHAIVDRAEPAATDPGRISLRIDKCDGSQHKSLTDTQQYLDITVQDNGVGMSPEVMNKIFDPYFTTRGGNGGSGLGLAVSLGIVQSHNGTITVESEVGNGTCFHVLLPQHFEE